MAIKWIERSPADLAFEDGKDLIRQRIRSALRPVNNRIMTMWSDEFKRALDRDSILTLTRTEDVDKMLLVATVATYGRPGAVEALLAQDPTLQRAVEQLQAGESE